MTASWLAPIWQQLTKRIESNSLSGGVLLLGDPGLGAIPLAKALARVLLCETSNTRACGECSGCRWVAQEQHPDLLVIQPDANTQVIKVDAIREMTDSLTQKASRGGYQVVIITVADALNVASSNALLKTLEEPAGQVVFFLCCAQQRALLPTIVSRCEQLTLPSVEYEQARDWLSTHHGGLGKPEQWLRWAEGAPYAITDLIDQQYEQWRDQLFSDFHQMAMKKADGLSLVSAWQKIPVSLMVRVLTSLMMDLIRLQSSAADERLMHRDTMDTLKTMAALLPSEVVWRYYDYLMEMQPYIKAGTVNERLIRDQLALSWEGCLDGKQELLRC